MKHLLMIFLLGFGIQCSSQSIYIGTNALFGTNIHPLKIESLSKKLGLRSLNPYFGGGFEVGYHFKETRWGLTLGFDLEGNATSNDSIGSDLRIFRIPILLCFTSEMSKDHKIVLSGGISFNQIRHEYYSLNIVDINYQEIKALPNTKYLNFVNHSISLMVSLAYPFFDQYSFVVRYQHSLFKSPWQSTFIKQSSLPSENFQSVELCFRYNLMTRQY